MLTSSLPPSQLVPTIFLGLFYYLSCVSQSSGSPGIPPNSAVTPWSHHRCYHNMWPPCTATTWGILMVYSLWHHFHCDTTSLWHHPIVGPLSLWHHSIVAPLHCGSTSTVAPLLFLIIPFLTRQLYFLIGSRAPSFYSSIHSHSFPLIYY